MKNIILIIVVLVNAVCFVTKTYADISKSDINLAQQILNKFTATRIQMSDFIQRGANGHISKGTFYMQRPGKIRFIYKHEPLNVIADGKAVLINNTLINSWNLYPLNKTPMKILLSNHINAKDGYLYDVEYSKKEIILVFKDPNANSAIYMNFDIKNHRLNKWTIVDEQEKATTIELLNEQHDIKFAKDMFDIPYKNTQCPVN